MSKFCPNCGSPLKPNTKFCPECGTKLMRVDSNQDMSSPTDYQYNNVEDLIQPINSKKATKKPKVKREKKEKVKKEKPSRSKGGCLKKFLTIIGILISLFIGLIFFIGNDDSTDYDQPPTIVIDNDYTALNQLTGFDFYNLDAIPYLETEDEFNEIYLPYMIRGVAERYRTVEYFGDIIFSDAFIESHTDEEWYEAMSTYSDMWAQVEFYAKTLESLLNETDFSASTEGVPNKFSAEYFITAYADEKVDWEEVGIYLRMAESSRANPAKMLMANMGLSAEKAKKIARTYSYQETRQKLNYSLDKDVRKREYQVNMLKMVNFVGKGAGVVAAVSSFGTLSLINQVGVFLCSTDTIVDMGEQTSTYFLGKNNAVSAYFLHLKDKITSKGSTIGSILSFNPNNLSKNVKLFDRLVEGFNLLKWGYDQGSDLNKGKILGVDLTTETPDTFIPADKAELLDKLRKKGVSENAVTLSLEEYQHMKSTNSWIDADPAIKDAYQNMRDQERQAEKDAVGGDAVESLVKDAIELYDAHIQGTDLEPALTIERLPARNTRQDSKPAKEKPKNNDREITSTNTDDTANNKTNNNDTDPTPDDTDSGPQVYDYIIACADRLNYDIDMNNNREIDYVLTESARRGFEDLAQKYNCMDVYNEIRNSLPSDDLEPQDVESGNTDTGSITMPEEFLNNDPFTARIWSRLQSLNTIEDNVIDEIMADIVWNITVSDNGKLSVSQMERIFRERSQSLYNDFSDLFNEVPSVEDTTSSNDPSTPPGSSNDTSNNNSNNGSPAKAEKEFMEFQAAKSYYDSLPEGPEKDAAYREMSTKHQLYMNALKK